MKFNLRPVENLLRLIEELSNGLSKLTLGDNFESFEAEFTVAAGAEAKIRNRLNSIPQQWIVTDIQGDGYLSKNTTEWTRDFVYLKNNGSASVTAKVVFLR